MSTAPFSHALRVWAVDAIHRTGWRPEEVQLGISWELRQAIRREVVSTPLGLPCVLGRDPHLYGPLVVVVARVRTEGVIWGNLAERLPMPGMPADAWEIAAQLIEDGMDFHDALSVAEQLLEMPD